MLIILKTRCGCSRKVESYDSAMKWFQPLTPDKSCASTLNEGSCPDRLYYLAEPTKREFKRTIKIEKHDDLTFVVFEEV